MCFVVTCWERADLLALVCGVFCEFVTFPLVSWVRCGTWLYRFLIFATLLTYFEPENVLKLYNLEAKTIVTNAYIAAVVGMIERDARITLQNIAHSVGILAGSAHKILTQQLEPRKVCAQ